MVTRSGSKTDFKSLLRVFECKDMTVDMREII